MADDEMYLENLKEYVIDEERIVTYKWLSRTLSVNVNQAKQMLYAFIQQQQKEKVDGLCIIYIVGGSMRDERGNLIQKYSFSLEEDLKDIKSCYEKITSLHVYSVQKNKPKDSNVLYLADYDLQKQNLDSPNRWSNITLKSITKRNRELPEEIVAKSESRILNEEKKKPIANGCKNPAQNKIKVHSTSTSSTSTKNSKKSKPLMKKSDVASFFARQAASKNEETVKTDNVESEKEEKKEEKSAMKKEHNKCDTTPINKNVEKPEKEEKEIEKEVEEKDVETKENKDELKTNVTDQADEDFQTKKSPKQGEKKSRKNQKQNKNEKENQEGKETKSKKRKTSSKEENGVSEGKTKAQRKKRKRVKNFSDTSSEEEDNSVNTKQSSTSTDTTSIPDQQAQDSKPEVQKNRRRKRVLKSKTYLNDEGYMVTEKVYESETASSEDEQKQPETEVKTNKPSVLKDSIQPPKKKAANKATKQASLTSFFKRT